MPTNTTLTAVRTSSLAPMSRNRSSWLTSSLRIDSSPPVDLVLEPGQLEALHVAVGVHAGLVLDGLRQVAPQQLGHVVGHRLDHPHDDVDQRQHDELVEPVLHPEHAGDQRLLDRTTTSTAAPMSSSGMTSANLFSTLKEMAATTVRRCPAA